MENVRITDMTLRELDAAPELSLSFKEKLEIAKCLDRMQPDVLELPELHNLTTDALLTRTIASTVRSCAVSIPVGFTAEEADHAWAAVSKAKNPRLNVIIPVSTVQMEYVCRKKPAAVLELIPALVSHCKALCPQVEFTAADATRAEPEFLRKAIRAAVEAGASTVTISDSAGLFLPEEFQAFLRSLQADIPELREVALSVQCMNELNMSTACAIAAMLAGAKEVKAAVSSDRVPTVSALAHVLALRGEELGLRCGIRTMEMQRLTAQVEWIAHRKEGKEGADAGLHLREDASFALSAYDNMDAVNRAALQLGYELSDDDLVKVFDAFRAAADKKEVSARELEAIIASVALQVPPTYTLQSFVINSGNRMSATSNIVLEKGGKELRGLCAGDGPIDASFLAIEQIAGTHYELDDFQIQAVTEGREAMGSAIVRLRSGGKVYSGRGISTDIIAAAIHAYISALNKIVYEEG